MGVGNQDQTAFEFRGDWKAFFPIAASNLLLTLVTLGVYRFWATTRERRYFWSQTRFIDDTLEWTGTGKELFLGFLMAIVALIVPVIGLQFLIQALILQGQTALAGALGVGFYFIILFLVGFATFRALRYRLSRTHWHGIRGGSEDPGFRYGLSYIWKTLVGALVLGLLIPWSMTSLWADRWNQMSFGPHRFESAPEWGGLMKRFLLLYLVPVAAVILGIVTAVSSGGGPGGLGAVVGLLVIAFYVVLPLIALGYYAAFFREVVNTLSLTTINFHFAARTKEWFLLFLGNAGLYVLALIAALIPISALGLFSGFADLQPGQDPFAQNPGLIAGMVLALIIPMSLVGPFIRYRNWRFFIRNLEATGVIDLDLLTQSQTKVGSHGEGLFDALDMGAM
ncbi:MAG: hypothetical protein RIQ75_354 [Pseudomonadota bacterium]